MIPEEVGPDEVGAPSPVPLEEDAEELEDVDDVALPDVPDALEPEGRKPGVEELAGADAGGLVGAGAEGASPSWCPLLQGKAFGGGELRAENEWPERFP